MTPPAPDDRKSYALWAWLYGRALGLVFLVAFASLGSQLRALIGARGLWPAAQQLDAVAAALGPGAGWELPTLAWWGASDGRLLFIAWLGAGAALLLMLGVLPGPALLVALAGYVSLVNVGGPFLRFQWDMLLIEAGFASLLVTPFALLHRPRTGPAPPPLARAVLMLLLAKLVFLSGCVKLASHDPTWADLSALSYHYWTQPLPTPLAYWAAKLPLWFQRGSCLVLFALELGTPLLLWLPFSAARRAAAAGISGLMLLILLTGNYGFFNWLALALCLPLLDDALLSRVLPWRAPPAPTPPRGAARRLAQRFGGALGVGVTALGIAAESELAPGGHGLRAWAAGLVAAIAARLAWVAYRERRAHLLRLAEKRRRTLPVLTATLWRVALPAARRRAIETLAVVFLFASASSGVARLSPSLAELVDPALSDLRPFHLFNDYGLFAVMTTERREIVLEGSSDWQHWKAYEFRYKPGALDRPLPIVLGHMPRLDWQMWFAALGSYRHNPWLVSLMHRLAQGDRPVLAELARNPFPLAPPRFVRALVYDYRFTSAAERARSGQIWARGEPRLYAPPISER